MLGVTAGENPVFDGELRGRVKATLAVLNVSYEDIYGENEDA